MTKKERFDNIISWFKKNMPVAETELNYKTPFQLLVAVILSAQCTDKRVNVITKELFKDFPSEAEMSQTSNDVIFNYIKTCSYPNNKAKNLVKMAKMLIDDFNGKIPSEVKDLIKLPGVGRKTANVIVSVIYNKPAMAVDTHVFRVSQRIGLSTNSKKPIETERQLVKYIPADLLPIAHHWLILHGRYVCLARNPKCAVCGISKWCKFYLKNNTSVN